MELIITEKQKSAKKVADALGSHVEVSKGKFKAYVSGDYVISHVSGHIVNWGYGSRFKIWKSIKITELIDAEANRVYDSICKAYFKELIKRYPIDIIGIFPDYDSEGELIASTIEELIKKIYETQFKQGKVSYYRYKTSVLNKREILSAITERAPINYPLAESADLKHRMDLQWGSVLTVVMTLMGNKLTSLGRVQTPVLGLIVDKQREIENFKPIPYHQYTLHTDFIEFKTDPLESIVEGLDRIKGVFYPEESVTKDLKRWPKTPLNSTDLLKFSTNLRIDAAGCMQLAESLYLKGAISYPRTESRFTDYDTIYGLMSSHREILYKRYDIKVGAKDSAHPPVMPTNTKPTELTGLESRLYSKIFDHYLEILAGVCIYDLHRYSLTIEGTVFNGYQELIKESGFKMMGEFKSLSGGVTVLESTLESKETKPPRMYSEGSIIKRMERDGIGTKSTRHTFVKLLRGRGYLEGFKPKPSARVLIDILDEYCPLLKSPKLTGLIQKDLALMAGCQMEMDVIKTRYSDILKGLVSNIQENRDTIVKRLRNIR